MVATKNEEVIFAEPAFELYEAAAVLARLAFGDKRRFLAAESVNVEVVSAATKAAGATERVALGMDANSAVRFDDLAFDTIAFASVTCAAPFFEAIAALSRRGYIRHSHGFFAGYAHQRGPAFSLPGTGSIDGCE
jgi:hypothetical protein